MAVYKHKGNTEQRQEFLITQNVMPEDSIYCFYVEMIFDDGAEKSFFCKKINDMTIIKQDTWEMTLNFTGPQAVFHRFLRS